MAIADSTVLAPKQIIVPEISSQGGVTPSTGTLGISGSKIYFFSGAAWEKVTSA